MRSYKYSVASGPPAKRRLWPTLRVIFWFAGVGVCAISLGLASAFLYLDPQIPSTETYRHYRFETPLRIYTADGELIGEFGDRRLMPITIEEVPRHFVDGLLSTEDKRFYQHAGIDFLSLINDVFSLLTTNVRTGASTITMQLAKVVSFSHQQVFIRKFKEMLLALKVEQELTKKEILELYVNLMSFGKHAYGVQAAAHTYYGKPVNELNLAQLAMLAGIIKKPEGGNPINGPEWALARRDLVLRRMRQQGAIDTAEYQQASAAPITARVFDRGVSLPAPYPSEWVRQELVDRYGPDIYSGFVAYTTLDSKLQAAAQSAVRRGLIGYDRRHGYRGSEGRAEVIFSRGGGAEGAVVDPLATAAALADYRVVGGLEAAVVIDVEERAARVVRSDGELVPIDWDGLRWARAFVDVDTRGPTPRTAAEIIAPGDVVRIERADGEWRLGQNPEIQGALVALDPKTGAVLALVGGWDFHGNQFNHALQAKRQPGSGFKPFIYSAALSNGVTPATVFWDAPLVFEDANLETVYRPRNDSGRFAGPMPLRRALYRSVNLVSIGVMMRVGAQSILDHVGNFGFETSGLPRSTQLAIGGGTMAFTPMDMARGYATFANGGYRIEPHLIERVERLDGTTVFAPEHPRVCKSCPPAAAAPPLAERAIDERNAFIMGSMLRDVIHRGTGRRARVLDRPDLGGKTGTTDGATDTWFNGFHPNLAATAWVGFSKPRPIGRREWGSTTPLSIWIDFMRDALAGEPVLEPLIPDGVVSVKVEPDTGRAAAPGDPDAVFEYFFADNLPERGTTVRSETDAPLLPEDIF